MQLQAVDIREDCRGGYVPPEVLASPVPVLLKGLVSHWPAVGACADSLEGTRRCLSRYWIDTPVTAYVGEAAIDGRFGYDDSLRAFNFRSGTGSLAQVFDRLEEQRRAEQPMSVYVGSTPVARWLPGFLDENPFPALPPDALISFWLGNRTRISAHFDFPDNIACVVAGTREFTLFPPEQVGNLYVGPLERTPSGQAISLVDVDRPDLERFPRFAEALRAARRCQCAPGDALFIPGMWWHHVRALSDCNLLVNAWWSNSPAYLGSPMTALMAAILGVRDLSARQRAAWRALFEHYVFGGAETAGEHLPESARGFLSRLDEDAARRLRAELANRLNR